MGNHTILLVDDDSGVRNAIERILRNEPYQRMYASDAIEAQKYIRRNKVHLVITDIMMPGIMGNPIQIKQIFDNVIKNAIDAMEKSEQKQLTIEIFEKDGFIVLKFSDTGEGIPKENIAKVFEPGFTTKPIGKGSAVIICLPVKIEIE
ncbi:MAG: response regulator [Deltaproteobacteria bacterium]|nr:response regulator [Deltaproteobacteria bacterium]